MNKVILVITLLVAGGIIYLVSTAPEPAAQDVQPRPEDHVLGNPDSSNILIEYGDFQCPACAAYHPVIKEFVEKNPDNVKFIARHFPLRSIHPNAQLAGQASEAAHLQGKFWEMYDKLYTSQKEWASARDPKEIFIRLATEIGLDKNKFESDLTSDTVRDIVNKDYTSAIANKLTSTPTFFFNGKKINNPSSLEGFEALLSTNNE